MIQIKTYCRIGQRNIARNLPCQDWVSQDKKGSITAIALADGTGETAHATLGAMVTANTLAGHLARHFRKLYDRSDDAVRYDVLATVRQALYDLCDVHGEDLKCFSSTFLAAAVDEKTDQFLLVHLGDGIARAETETGNKMLSYGEHGASPRYTVLSTTQGALPHIRVVRGSTKDLTRLCLYSDGWGSDPPLQFTPDTPQMLDDTSGICLTFHCKTDTM